MEIVGLGGEAPEKGEGREKKFLQGVSRAFPRIVASAGNYSRRELEKFRGECQGWEAPAQRRPLHLRE